jgi:hypothetical protein
MRICGLDLSGFAQRSLAGCCVFFTVTNMTIVDDLIQAQESANCGRFDSLSQNYARD